MPPEMRQLDCPSCGASLEVKNAQRAKSIVCQHCGSQIDLTDPQYGILGQTILNSAPPRTPIALGMTAEFDGERYQTIGRVRYREDEFMWDEWLLMTEEGRFKWLTEGEDGFTLYDTIVPTNPVDPRTVEDTLNLEGTVDAEVAGQGIGRIDYLEGELTWKAAVGDRVSYMDADFPGERANYAVEWTDDEVEFFKGKKLTNGEVRRAFGLPELAVAGKGFVGSKILVVLAIVVAVLCICAALAAVSGGVEINDDGDGTSISGGIFIGGPGTYGSGPSNRNSSPGGRSSGGGGSSSGGGK